LEDLSRKLRTFAIEIASSFHGVKEATGHNDGKQIEEFQEHQAWLKGLPWCSCFVSYCFLKAAGKLKIERPFPQIAAVDNLKAYAKHKGWYHDNVSFIPQAGDIFVHIGKTADQSHTGFVKDFIDGKIITMEGNISNKVSSRKFLKTDAYITGFIRVMT